MSTYKSYTYIYVCILMYTFIPSCTHLHFNVHIYILYVCLHLHFCTVERETSMNYRILKIILIKKGWPRSSFRASIDNYNVYTTLRSFTLNDEIYTQLNTRTKDCEMGEAPIFTYMEMLYPQSRLVNYIWRDAENSLYFSWNVINHR